MRLIDADTLLKDLTFLYTIHHIPINMKTKKILETIMEQPTVYDIDKIVEELEANKQNALEVEESIKEYNVWNEAIEIVKQGGAVTEAETIRDKVIKWNNNSSKRVPYEFIDYVEGKREIIVSDDVCEWKLNGVYLISPHPLVALSCITNYGYRYNYCPVCGKKIKAVE